jgi:ribose-phosphate pyrophosphokinase
MRYLNLDSAFTPYGNGIQFETFTFSGGEIHFRIVEDVSSIDEITITCRPTSFNDMGTILIAADALQRAGVKSLSLIIPYFPAARQDRIMVSGESLTVKIYADLINSVGFESVVVFDPHSDVTPALINNVKVCSNHVLVNGIVSEMSDYHLISPDGGALKKVHKLAQYLDADSVIECSKVRNVKTGKLSGFAVYADDLQGKTCLVVDDICDGGGTFLGLADELKQKNAGKLILVVSHGIFSKGTDLLQEKYDEIYSSDSFTTHENNGIECVKLTKENLK